MAAAALAGGIAPRVTLDWRGDVGTVEVWLPLDTEVAADAPATLRLEQAGRAVQWEADGASVLEGVQVGVVRSSALSGTLSLSLCDKSDGTCTPRSFDLDGWTSHRKRGQAVLGVTEAAVAATAVPGTHGPDYQTDAAQIAQRAFEAAAIDGKRVILDFGAVWCPPCNLMSAEVFHAAEPPEILGNYHLAVLDVDDPRSFALKDRYAVGGYPTVVIVTADGSEISRQVGYPGRDEVVSWLARAAEQDGPDTDFAQIDPATVDPGRAAEVAWLLVKNRKGGAEPWVERASEGEETRELRLARVSIAPNIEDARWLAVNAPGTTADWVYPAKALAETAEGRDVLRTALQADLHGQTGSKASDLLYLLAEVASEADKSLMYAASATALRTGLTGDPEHDRGHYTWLAVLTERGGDPQGAAELLQQSIERWPDEPTFYLAEAGLWLRNDEPGRSLEAARSGMSASWGDNKLRMADAACQALVALERADEARELAAQVLKDVPPPQKGLGVRSFRYREKLQAFVDGD